MQVPWKIRPVGENRAPLGCYAARSINYYAFHYNFSGVVLLVFFAMTLYQLYVFDSWACVSVPRFSLRPGFDTSSWGDGQCPSFYGFLVIAIPKFEVIFVIFTVVLGHQNHYHLLSPNCSSLIIHLNFNSSIFYYVLQEFSTKLQICSYFLTIHKYSDTTVFWWTDIANDVDDLHNS
jgi:hypothetical protein